MKINRLKLIDLLNEKAAACKKQREDAHAKDIDLSRKSLIERTIPRLEAELKAAKAAAKIKDDKQFIIALLRDNVRLDRYVSDNGDALSWEEQRIAKAIKMLTLTDDATVSVNVELRSILES